MNRSHKFLLVAVLLSAPLGAAACGSDGPSRPSDPVLAQGFDVYNANCARCHGTAGKGGLGTTMVNVENRLTVEQQVLTIENGRGSMPAWKGQLTPEQIDAVTRYTREVF